MSLFSFAYCQFDRRRVLFTVNDDVAGRDDVAAAAANAAAANYARNEEERRRLRAYQNTGAASANTADQTSFAKSPTLGCPFDSSGAPPPGDQLDAVRLVRLFQRVCVCMGDYYTDIVFCSTLTGKVQHLTLRPDGLGQDAARENLGGVR